MALNAGRILGGVMASVVISLVRYLHVGVFRSLLLTSAGDGILELERGKSRRTTP